MSVLFQAASLSIPQGLHESAVVPVPGGIKKAGVPLLVRATLGQDNFPAAGLVTVTLFYSVDGGLTFKSGSVGWAGPYNFRGPAPHTCYCQLLLLAEDSPTHVKYATDSPQAFTTTVTLEAV